MYWPRWTSGESRKKTVIEYRHSLQKDESYIHFEITAGGKNPEYPGRQGFQKTPRKRRKKSLFVTGS